MIRDMRVLKVIVSIVAALIVAGAVALAGLILLLVGRLLRRPRPDSGAPRARPATRSDHRDVIDVTATEVEVPPDRTLR